MNRAPGASPPSSAALPSTSSVIPSASATAVVAPYPRTTVIVPVPASTDWTSITSPDPPGRTRSPTRNTPMSSTTICVSSDALGVNVV